MAHTIDRHLTPEQEKMESVVGRCVKAAAVGMFGVVLVAALYFGLIYVLTLH